MQALEVTRGTFRGATGVRMNLLREIHSSGHYSWETRAVERAAEKTAPKTKAKGSVLGDHSTRIQETWAEE
jgi:hypothetical protein